MKDGIQFRVSPDGPIAVYRQIENHVQFAIASGRLKAGQSLPSVRDLSDMLNVNPNTVTKAIRDLELKGLLTTRRGIGVAVSDNARQRCKDTVQNMVRRHLRNGVGQCLSAGMTATQIKKLVDEAVRSNFQPYSD